MAQKQPPDFARGIPKLWVLFLQLILYKCLQLAFCARWEGMIKDQRNSRTWVNVLAKGELDLRIRHVQENTSKILLWRHAGGGLRKRENKGMCLLCECTWASTAPKLPAPKTAPLCRLSARTQLRTSKSLKSSKEDNSGQIRRGEKHEINHPTLAYHILQAPGTPKVSPFHQTPPSILLSLPQQAIPPQPGVYITQPCFNESLTKCMTHFTEAAFISQLCNSLSDVNLFAAPPPSPIRKVCFPSKVNKIIKQVERS